MEDEILTLDNFCTCNQISVLSYSVVFLSVCVHDVCAVIKLEVMCTYARVRVATNQHSWLLNDVSIHRIRQEKK